LQLAAEIGWLPGACALLHRGASLCAASGDMYERPSRILMRSAFETVLTFVAQWFHCVALRRSVRPGARRADVLPAAQTVDARRSLALDRCPLSHVCCLHCIVCDSIVCCLHSSHSHSVTPALTPNHPHIHSPPQQQLHTIDLRRKLRSLGYRQSAAPCRRHCRRHRNCRGFQKRTRRNYAAAAHSDDDTACFC